MATAAGYRHGESKPGIVIVDYSSTSSKLTNKLLTASHVARGALSEQRYSRQLVSS